MTVAHFAAKWAIWIEAMSWTIGRLLQWTTDYLQEHGAENPRLDAEVLLAHARGCQRIDLYTAFNECASEAVRTDFRQLVKRRAEGTPVAYLVGYREFYSLRFRVTPDVLIPRPETEFVLVALLDLLKGAGQLHQPLRLADVGTGSGNLAIAAAVHLPQAEITAIDLSADAIQVAIDNARQHHVDDRIRFVQSDLFAAIAESERFEYIVSNPPYIGLREKQQLSRDVIDHEPHVALFAGETGIDVLTPLIAQAEHRLMPNGWLLTEISPFVRDELLRVVAAHPGLQHTHLREDLARQPRVLCTQRQR
jgi:release factor glutamine methyltransferase